MELNEWASGHIFRLTFDHSSLFEKFFNSCRSIRIILVEQLSVEMFIPECHLEKLVGLIMAVTRNCFLFTAAYNYLYLF